MHFSLLTDMQVCVENPQERKQRDGGETAGLISCVCGTTFTRGRSSQENEFFSSTHTFSQPMNQRPKAAVQMAPQLSWAEQTAPSLGEQKVLISLCAQGWEVAAWTQVGPAFLSQPSLLTLPPPGESSSMSASHVAHAGTTWKCIYRDRSVLQWHVSHPSRPLHWLSPRIQKVVLSLIHLEISYWSFWSFHIQLTFSRKLFLTSLMP